MYLFLSLSFYLSFSLYFSSGHVSFLRSNVSKIISPFSLNLFVFVIVFVLEIIFFPVMSPLTPGLKIWRILIKISTTWLALLRTGIVKSPVGVKKHVSHLRGVLVLLLLVLKSVSCGFHPLDSELNDQSLFNPLPRSPKSIICFHRKEEGSEIANPMI